MSRARLRAIAITAAVLFPLLFAAFTQHAWEDYYITLRSSRNLVDGHGLVFNPGERVHTFTSPLGVLVPALCTALAGPDREELALWLFRLINVALLGVAAGLVWRRAEALRLGAVGRVLLFGLIFADAKLVDFSINGMETAILVFFVLLLWSELESDGAPRIPVLGLGLAGLLWTRPDAFVLGGALLAARGLIRGRDPARRVVPWSQLIRGTALAGLLYAPWFLWAAWYYGSPVPHTIIAKSAYTPPLDPAGLLLLPWRTLAGQSMLLDLFLPTYWSFGGWPSLLPRLAHALTGVAAFAWMVPALPVTARRASLAVFIGMFYLCSIVLFPWYVPPWTALAAIAIAFLVDGLHAGALARGLRVIGGVCRVASTAVVAVQVGILAASAWQMRIEQRLVENDVRREIGEWLRRNAAPGDTVFLEPLGYIGYFSQLKTHDFPGLSSPEVVAAVRGGARRYSDLIAHLRPTWVVLRPLEAAHPEFKQNPVLADYELVRTRDATPQLDRVRFLPGRPWVEREAHFLVYRRKTGPGETERQR